MNQLYVGLAVWLSLKKPMTLHLRTKSFASNSELPRCQCTLGVGGDHQCHPSVEAALKKLLVTDRATLTLGLADLLFLQVSNIEEPPGRSPHCGYTTSFPPRSERWPQGHTHHPE